MSDPQKSQPSVATQPPAPQTPAARPDDKPRPATPAPAAAARKPEIGGPKGPEPTRYGDWEKSGRCVDF